MSKYLTAIANRYNGSSLIKLCMVRGSSMSFNKRWQYSVLDSNGKHHDFYFVCKPTRKQIRNLIKQFNRT